MKPEETLWVAQQLEKRGLKKPECDTWQYDVSYDNVEAAHNDGIDNAVDELVLPLLQENESLRENAAILLEYLEREYSQGRFSLRTKYGSAFESLRSLITDKKS